MVTLLLQDNNESTTTIIIRIQANNQMDQISIKIINTSTKPVFRLLN